MIYSIEYNGESSEFLLEEENNSVVMKYSGTDTKWTRPNEQVAKLKNTVDSVVVKLEGKELELDYAEVEVLYMLLTYYMKEMETYKPTIYKLERTLVV